MKTVSIVAGSVGIALASWYVATQPNEHPETSLPVSVVSSSVSAVDVKAPEVMLPEPKVIAKAKTETSQAIAHQETPVVTSAAKSLSRADERLNVWTEIESRLAQGEISIELEKQLITALREQDDPSVYAAISQALQVVDKDLETRNQEYLLSLLAVINTKASVDLLLATLTNTPVTDSNAIYVAKQSLQHIAQSPDYLAPLTATFEAMDSDNVFLPDIAKGIAAQAGEAEVAFLVTQAEANNDKSAIALASMANLSDERLVPSLQAVINTRSSDNPLTATSLRALANMGQYEAGVALLQWSALQTGASAGQVEDLFELAAQRSPSTYRAIEKQLHRHTFASSEVKAVIERIYANKP